MTISHGKQGLLCDKNCPQTMKTDLARVKTFVPEGGKCLILALSLFPQCFQKLFCFYFLWVFITRNCLENI